MSTIQVYEEPSESRLALLQELSRRPTTVNVLPEEDQLTIALGWLCDHSEVVARAIAKRFLGQDPEGLEALESADSLGARVQVRLPPLAKSGPLWADLSISGSNRSFQLLIESKLGSGFHAYQVGRKRLLRPAETVVQPDAYLSAWRNCDAKHEAAVRRVGTVRLDGAAPGGSEPWRAADLIWSDLQEVIHSVLEKGIVETEARLFAQELDQHLQQRVLPPTYDEPLLTRGRDLCRDVSRRLAEEVTAVSLKRSSFRVNARSQYGGGGSIYLKLPSGKEARFWIGVTPRATAYNVPGWDDVLQIQLA